MDKTSKHFTISDLETIYAAAWTFGACNLRGLANDLPTIIDKARAEVGEGLVAAEHGDKHPAVKLFMGHMAYLAGIGLGSELDHVRQFEELLEQRKGATVLEAS